MAGKTAWRQGDGRDDLVASEIGVALGSITGQTMKVAQGDGPLAGGPGDRNGRLKHGKRHAQVGRVGGDARFAGAEDGVHAIEAGYRRAAASGLALVAGGGNVIEVMAARAL